MLIVVLGELILWKSITLSESVTLGNQKHQLGDRVLLKPYYGRTCKEPETTNFHAVIKVAWDSETIYNGELSDCKSQNSKNLNKWGWRFCTKILRACKKHSKLDYY